MQKTSYLEYLENFIERKQTDYNNPNCINCNECCGISTVIMPEELIALKKYLKTDKHGKIAYKEAKARFKKHFSGGTLNLMCPFNNSGKHCAIYSHRPQICRDYHCTVKYRGPKYDIEKLENQLHYSIYDLFRGKE